MCPSDDLDSIYGPFTHTFEFTAKASRDFRPEFITVQDEVFIQDESPEQFSIADMNQIFENMNFLFQNLQRVGSDVVAVYGAAAEQLVKEILPPMLKALEPVKEYLEAEKQQDKISGMCPIHKIPRRKGGQCKLCMKKLIKNSGHLKQR